VVPLVLLFAGVAAGEYAGAEACKGCHPSEYAAQSATAHARALSRSRAGQPGEWAFGAGSQAITFVSRADADHYLEHGETWYTKLGRYARTPGHREAGGVRYRIFDPSAAILRCFACHSTGPVSIAEGGAIVPAELGVRCEDCHGPAAAHVSDPRRAQPVQPARMSAAAINRTCGACHRMSAGPEAPVNLHDPWNARHQPLMLAAGACFQLSGGRLNCFTCHAPHAPLERTAAAYDARCVKCHAAVRHQTAVAGTACAECHMPRVALGPGLSFANHRIGIYAPEAPMRPLSRR
jgi:hypothetical protein